MVIETLQPVPSGSTPDAGPIVASWLGRVDYREALELQKRLVTDRAEGRIADQLLLLEHPPVLTLGRTADPSHIRVDAATLAARGIEVVRVERGGEVTYHGPGQLVAYPILALSAARAIPAAGAIPTARIRARSPRSGCASSAA